MALDEGLERIKNTSFRDWIELLRHRDENVQFDTASLKILWDKYTQEAIDDFRKFDPIQAYLEDYNRMKKAFDKFAEERDLPKWRSGVSNDEWLSP